MILEINKTAPQAYLGNSPLNFEPGTFFSSVHIMPAHGNADKDKHGDGG
jgi:hypothetical protein